MKKYIVTDKHPALKKGIIIQKTPIKAVCTDDGENYSDLFALFYIENDKQVFVDHVIDIPITELLESGWIKEIEEKEFTKSDMLSFKRDIQYSNFPDYEVLLNRWIKKHKTPE